MTLFRMAPMIKFKLSLTPVCVGGLLSCWWITSRQLCLLPSELLAILSLEMIFRHRSGNVYSFVTLWLLCDTIPLYLLCIKSLPKILIFRTIHTCSSWVSGIQVDPFPNFCPPYEGPPYKKERATLLTRRGHATPPKKEIWHLPELRS